MTRRDQRAATLLLFLIIPNVTYGYQQLDTTAPKVDEGVIQNEEYQSIKDQPWRCQDNSNLPKVYIAGSDDNLYHVMNEFARRRGPYIEIQIYFYFFNEVEFSYISKLPSTLKVLKYVLSKYPHYFYNHQKADINHIEWYIDNLIMLPTEDTNSNYFVDASQNEDFNINNKVSIRNPVTDTIPRESKKVYEFNVPSSKNYKGKDILVDINKYIDRKHKNDKMYVDVHATKDKTICYGRTKQKSNYDKYDSVIGENKKGIFYDSNKSSANSKYAEKEPKYYEFDLQDTKNYVGKDINIDILHPIGNKIIAPKKHANEGKHLDGSNINHSTTKDAHGEQRDIKSSNYEGKDIYLDVYQQENNDENYASDADVVISKDQNGEIHSNNLYNINTSSLNGKEENYNEVDIPNTKTVIKTVLPNYNQKERTASNAANFDIVSDNDGYESEWIPKKYYGISGNKQEICKSNMRQENAGLKSRDFIEDNIVLTSSGQSQGEGYLSSLETLSDFTSHENNDELNSNIGSIPQTNKFDNIEQPINVQKKENNENTGLPSIGYNKLSNTYELLDSTSDGSIQNLLPSKNVYIKEMVDRKTVNEDDIQTASKNNNFNLGTGYQSVFSSSEDMPAKVNDSNSFLAGIPQTNKFNNVVSPVNLAKKESSTNTGLPFINYNKLPTKYGSLDTTADSSVPVVFEYPRYKMSSKNVLPSRSRYKERKGKVYFDIPCKENGMANEVPVDESNIESPFENVDLITEPRKQSTYSSSEGMPRSNKVANANIESTRKSNNIIPRNNLAVNADFPYIDFNKLSTNYGLLDSVSDRSAPVVVEYPRYKMTSPKVFSPRNKYKERDGNFDIPRKENEMVDEVPVEESDVDSPFITEPRKQHIYSISEGMPPRDNIANTNIGSMPQTRMSNNIMPLNNIAINDGSKNVDFPYIDYNKLSTNYGLMDLASDSSAPIILEYPKYEMSSRNVYIPKNVYEEHTSKGFSDIAHGSLDTTSDSSEPVVIEYPRYDAITSQNVISPKNIFEEDNSNGFSNIPREGNEIVDEVPVEDNNIETSFKKNNFVSEAEIQGVYSSLEGIPSNGKVVNTNLESIPQTKISGNIIPRKSPAKNEGGESVEFPYIDYSKISTSYRSPDSTSGGFVPFVLEYPQYDASSQNILPTKSAYNEANVKDYHFVPCIKSYVIGNGSVKENDIKKSLKNNDYIPEIGKESDFSISEDFAKPISENLLPNLQSVINYKGFDANQNKAARGSMDLEIPNLCAYLYKPAYKKGNTNLPINLFMKPNIYTTTPSVDTSLHETSYKTSSDNMKNILYSQVASSRDNSSPEYFAKIYTHGTQKSYKQIFDGQNYNNLKSSDVENVPEGISRHPTTYYARSNPLSLLQTYYPCHLRFDSKPSYSSDLNSGLQTQSSTSNQPIDAFVNSPRKDTKQILEQNAYTKPTSTFLLPELQVQSIQPLNTRQINWPNLYHKMTKFYSVPNISYYVSPLSTTSGTNSININYPQTDFSARPINIQPSPYYMKNSVVKKYQDKPDDTSLGNVKPYNQYSFYGTSVSNGLFNNQGQSEFSHLPKPCPRPLNYNPYVPYKSKVQDQQYDYSPAKTTYKLWKAVPNMKNQDGHRQKDFFQTKAKIPYDYNANNNNDISPEANFAWVPLKSKNTPKYPSDTINSQRLKPQFLTTTMPSMKPSYMYYKPGIETGPMPKISQETVTCSNPQSQIPHYKSIYPSEVPTPSPQNIKELPQLYSLKQPQTNMLQKFKPDYKKPFIAKPQPQDFKYTAKPFSPKQSFIKNLPRVKYGSKNVVTVPYSNFICSDTQRTPQIGFPTITPSISASKPIQWTGIQNPICSKIFTGNVKENSPKSYAYSLSGPTFRDQDMPEYAPCTHSKSTDNINLQLPLKNYPHTTKNMMSYAPGMELISPLINSVYSAYPSSFNTNIKPSPPSTNNGETYLFPYQETIKLGQNLPKQLQNIGNLYRTGAVKMSPSASTSPYYDTQSQLETKSWPSKLYKPIINIASKTLDNQFPPFNYSVNYKPMVNYETNNNNLNWLRYHNGNIIDQNQITPQQFYSWNKLPPTPLINPFPHKESNPIHSLNTPYSSGTISNVLPNYYLPLYKARPENLAYNPLKYTQPFSSYANTAYPRPNTPRFKTKPLTNKDKQPEKSDLPKSNICYPSIYSPQYFTYPSRVPNYQYDSLNKPKVPQGLNYNYNTIPGGTTSVANLLTNTESKYNPSSSIPNLGLSVDIHRASNWLLKGYPIDNLIQNSEYNFNWNHDISKSSYNPLRPFEKGYDYSTKPSTSIYGSNLFPEANPTLSINNIKDIYKNKIDEELPKTLTRQYFENNFNDLNANSYDKLKINLGNVAVAKYEDNNRYLIKTDNPAVELLAWRSKVKTINADLVLNVHDYPAVNFVPVIKGRVSEEEASAIAKDVVSRLYGEPLVVRGVFSAQEPYGVVSGERREKYNVLWPTLCNCGCMKSGCRCSFRN